jgi:hypothetical protein
VKQESIAFDKILITLQVDEGAKVWCAAWSTTTVPVIDGSTYISAIKGKSADCSDSPQGNMCGTFWIYDLDDLEDDTGDGVASQADYDDRFAWKFNRDVDIVLSGLTAETDYTHIYCHAEDDESDGLGNSPNPTFFDTGAADASKVSVIQAAIGTVRTLDESPPSFTSLSVQDPTAQNNQITITLELNEPGTAYCRATRSDSGEMAADMPVDRILTANWSGEYLGTPVTINMDKLENVDPSMTNRDDWDSFFAEAKQYNIYCWAQDAATDTFGNSRPNYMHHAYVTTAVSDPSAPSGGLTAQVWIADATPPTLILVDVEALNDETIQMTLQLNEPGTIWCQASELDSSSETAYCKGANILAAADGTPCYFETFIKGSATDSTVFRSDVHTQFRNVEIEVNRIWESDASGSKVLEHEYPYKIFCFAEDDWKIQADAASPASVGFFVTSGTKQNATFGSGPTLK